MALNATTNAEPDLNPTTWTLLGKNLNPRGQFVQIGSTDVSHVSFVQTQANFVGGNTAAITFAQSNTAGNTIIVMARAEHGFIASPFDPNYTFTVTDSQGNTYTPLAGHTYSVNSANGTLDSQLYIAKNIKAGPNTITVTTTSGAFMPAANTYNMSAEYSGHATFNPLVNFATKAVAGPATSISVTLGTTQVNQI